MELNSYDILKTPIMYIKATKFGTDLTDFGTLKRDVDENKNFKIIFKTLYEYCENFDVILIEKLGDNLHKLTCDSNMSKKYIDDVIFNTLNDDLKIIEKEIMTVLPDHWNLLNNSNGRTKIHILYALIFLICEIKQNKAYISDYDENILLWAMLLHDIAKHVVLFHEATEDFTKRW
jgi:hypothetical protein